MVEFDELFNKIYFGKEAIKRKVDYRLKHSTRDIPYYDRGVDLDEFTYGRKDIALRLALKDMNANVKYDDKNSRIQVYDVTINCEGL